MNSNNMVSGRSNFLFTTRLAAVFGILMIVIALTIRQSQVSQVFTIGEFFSGIGNDAFLILSNGALFYLAWRKGSKSIFYLTVKLDAAVYVIVQSIKRIDFGPWALRPNGELGGFPSGHTTHAFVMAYLLSMFFPRLSWLWFSCASVIAWSRIETDWHTGLQVIAGVIFGVGLSWFFINDWLKKSETVKFNSSDTTASRGSVYPAK